MSKVVEVFKQIAGSGARLSDRDRLRRVGDEGGNGQGPIAGIPGLYREDANLILAAMQRAPAPELPGPADNSPRRTRRATLEAEIAKLREEIADREARRKR